MRFSTVQPPTSNSLSPHLMLLFTVFSFAHAAAAAGSLSLRLLRSPQPLSSSTSAAFLFDVAGADASVQLTCKLDNYTSSKCDLKRAYYTGLPDGYHTFELCASESKQKQCTSYTWSVDTVPPTAYVSAETPFTNGLNVSVHISFSEPCTGDGGFQCSMSDCNLLVYGTGHVLPSTLKILQPDIEFSVVVAISEDILYGRLVLVMDKGFCSDAAGNSFTRASNSSFLVHFDRRNVTLNFKTRIPQKLLQFNGQFRTIEATNSNKNLKIYVYFSEPVLNSSSQILGALHTSSGLLLPTNSDSLGNRRFGYLVNNLSRTAIVTVSCDTSSIMSRQGTLISATDSTTFLYDVQRPSVMLSTSSGMKTRKHHVPVWIKFTKPVIDFNSSSVLVSGGQLLSFHEVSKGTYTIDVQADDSVMSVEVPENIAADVAGNKNLASNRLNVRQYTRPVISLIISTMVITAFPATSFTAALLTITTASLLSAGLLSSSTNCLVSDPSRNLMRFAYHIQVFALSKLFTVTLPIEYQEFAMDIEWIIPYLSLPWETGGDDTFKQGSRFHRGEYIRNNLNASKSLLDSIDIYESDEYPFGMPLTPIEYRSFLKDLNMIPEAGFLTASKNSNGWIYFGRNMFWLAVIGGGLFLLHSALFLSLAYTRKRSEQEFGQLVFPRFEIFLIILALPCTCQAATTIVRGGSTAGKITGILILGILLFLMLSFLLFLLFGITMGKLLKYKDLHQVGQEFHWYQEIISVCLGPGNSGQWTWKNQANFTQLMKLGPLFEDLRGPANYMLSQVDNGGNQGKLSDHIITSGQTEDAEAHFIRKFFGLMRIYYTFLELVRRATFGVLAGAFPYGTSSRLPVLVALSITTFQLFFIVLTKPFINKKVQLVEIISLAGEVGLFGACLVLLEMDFSFNGEKKVGIFMLAMFTISFAAQLVNEWYSLFRQVLSLSPGGDSLFSGLKAAFIGLLLLVLPANMLNGLELEKQFSVANQRDEDIGRPVSPGRHIHRSSGGTDKLWLRQLRELAKASFSRNDGGGRGDPSSSRNKEKTDAKAKSRGLHKDLEAIFSSK